MATNESIFLHCGQRGYFFDFIKLVADHLGTYKQYLIAPLYPGA
ncbi:hypothetical protein [Mucilaginibacter phyllosphaerae]